MAKRPLFLLFFLAVATWSLPSFAQTAYIATGNVVANEVAGITTTNAITLTINSGVDIGVPAWAPNTNAAIIKTDGSAVTLNFAGNSTVYGYIGVGAAGGRYDSIVVNAGVVNFKGYVRSVAYSVGTGTANFQSGDANNAGAGNFTGDGKVEISSNTTLTGALTTNTDNTGTLVLNSGSLLTGAVGVGGTAIKNITVSGGSNTAGVTGSITGAVFSNSFTLATNTLSINGAMTLSAAGSINTTLASESVYGNIRLTGATNLPAALTVNVTVPASATFPVGTIFNIVQTQTGTLQSGTDGAVVTVAVVGSSNPLYTFAPVPLGGTAAGLVAIKATGTPLTASITPPAGVVLPAAAPASAAVAGSLNNATQTPDILTIQAALNAMSDPVAIVNAEAQLAASATGIAAPLVAFEGSQQFQNLWLSRLDDVMCGQVSQRKSEEQKTFCAENANKSGWWLKGFGHFGSQDSKGSFTGYDSRILGTMIAYDFPLGSNTRAGLGGGYAQSEITGKAYDTRTDIASYRGTAYIAYEPGSFFVDGSASAGWNEYTGKRHISFPGVSRVASAEYSGQDYTGFATAGYHFFAKGFTLTPLASLQYTHMDVSGYSETGAGDVSLFVDHQKYNFLESSAGAKLARAFDVRGKTLVPEVHFKWFHEILNPSLKNVASFSNYSSKFASPGFKADDNLYNIGAGLTLLSCACTDRVWSVEAVYDYDWNNSSYTSHEGMLRVSGRF